jgi:hypothetical protein
MEKINYKIELRALLSIRNFKNSLEKHFEQMLSLEKNMDDLNKNAISIIEANCSELCEYKCRMAIKEVEKAMKSVNEIIKSAKEKIENRDRSDSSLLWVKFDVNLCRLIDSYKSLEKIGFELLPEREHTHWEKDICNFESTILPLIVLHADTCRTELKLIEKYTPKELHKITEVIFNQIPEDFTFEESDKYEEEYLKALSNFKKEFSDEKNLWDKFLDILAGGTHQTPSESVMMKRWLEGEKRDL